METVLSSAENWVIRKSVLLETVIPPELKLCRNALFVNGFDKENNVIFVWTQIVIFMINLESVKFTKVSTPTVYSTVHPYSCATALQVLFCAIWITAICWITHMFATWIYLIN